MTDIADTERRRGVSLQAKILTAVIGLTAVVLIIAAVLGILGI